MTIDGAHLKEQLEELARNLWWTWHPETIDVWRSIDPALWRECRHSPVVFLKKLDEARLEDLARDSGLRLAVRRAMFTLGWRFSADRMVKDYVRHCYRPAGGISTSEMKGPFT